MAVFVYNVTYVCRDLNTRLPGVANDRSEEGFMHKISQTRVLDLFFDRLQRYCGRSLKLSCRCLSLLRDGSCYEARV